MNSEVENLNSAQIQDLESQPITILIESTEPNLQEAVQDAENGVENSSISLLVVSSCNSPIHPSVYNTVPIDEIDIGVEPNWELAQTCCRTIYRLEMPESDSRKLYAFANLRNKSSCRILMSRNREIPVIKDAHFKLDSIESTFLEGLCSHDELQEFCDGAAIYCKDTIRKLNHLVLFYNIASYLSLILFVFFAFLFLALNQVVLTFALVGLFMLFIYGFHHKFFVYVRSYPEKVNKKLAEYLTFNKINLAQIGINPRPGPFGTYIEFTAYA